MGFDGVDIHELLEALGIDADSKGRSLWAACPLPDHDEDTPSWHIEDRPGEEKHGWWRCFGCKEGGGIVGLVRAVEGLETTREAIEWLRTRGLLGDGEAVPEIPGALGVTVAPRARRRRRLCAMPREISFEPLDDWPTPPKRYALSRGLTPAQVKRWGIGYAIDSRLAGRIVFVTRSNLTKLPLRYNGRAFTARKKPKYLGPEKGSWFDEGAVFGEQEWPEHGARETVFVNEGELNALACERAGAACVAALSGSELIGAQLSRIATFKRIVVVSDPDSAGDKLWEGLRSLGRWSKLGRIRFEEGDSCDQPLAELRKHIERWS